MAYTEFYCDASSGDNLNAGTGGTNDYTSAGGNWANGTRVFTVTDGTNPSNFISVNDFCAVYVTAGATVATFVGRASNVQNATNGTVTFSTAFLGANPANGTGTMTLKHGGFWKGPNAAVAFPLDRAQIASAMNTNSDQVRINFKSGTTYSVTAAITTGGGTADITIQGYTSSAGDGGRATLDFGTTTGTLLTENSTRPTWADMIFASSATSGTGTLFFLSSSVTARLVRCVAHGARNVGFFDSASLNSTFIECEAYDNNKSNTANSGGFVTSEAQTPKFLRCYSHDNTGSNSRGFYIGTTAQGAVFDNCIADTNGGIGFEVASTTGIAVFYINCEAYNNTSDGIKLGTSASSSQLHWIENCNLIKNGGKGINNAAGSSQWVQGFVYNCGYGAGTQANGGGDSTLAGLQESGKVTYANDVTPWVAPTTGNFSINLAAAQSVGRGAFTETDGTNTGTVGYPDIGAAQSQITSGGGSQRAYTFGG